MGKLTKLLHKLMDLPFLPLDIYNKKWWRILPYKRQHSLLVGFLLGLIVGYIFWVGAPLDVSIPGFSLHLDPGETVAAIGNATTATINSSLPQDQNTRNREEINQQDAVSDVGLSIGRTERLVYRYTNKIRENRGFSSLGYNERLAGLAGSYTEFMARNGEIGHRVDGRSVLERYGGLCSYVGENVLYTGYSYVNESKAADRILDIWMNSRGHRENILREGWSEIGVGVVDTGDRIYATQAFCG